MDDARKPEAGCGAAILDRQGRLLLIQRLREPEAGAWGLPGGKIDFGEAARDTARREIAEELGIEIEILGLACIAETIERGDGRHWVAPVYNARIVSGEPRIVEPEKHGGWGWFKLDALPAPLTMAAVSYMSVTGTQSREK
ncbi:NUDIX domain-containing protein [Hyphomonas sp.]|uniref:NUDIX hydrolase n=1 Tax=Hyphomonas sp. TaxID=87 RepID=UPI0025C36AF0|nr:NUDIX domain-containing protein [Hyphomonas sp.]